MALKPAGSFLQLFLPGRNGLRWVCAVVGLRQYLIKAKGTNVYMDNKDVNAKFFNEFAQKSKWVYKFINLQNEYYNVSRDYGSDTLLTMVEIHTLTYIEENPGITITELAQCWRRTKGAVSQTVMRLGNKGFIKRVRQKVNARKVQIYANEDGIKLSHLHKAYDLEDLRLTLDDLLKEYTVEEITAFLKVINCYNELLGQELG